MTIDFRDQAPDADSYLDLFETTGWNADYRARVGEIRTALAGSFACVSAWHGPRLVGTARAISDGALYALLVDVIVHPAYQGQGVGSRLVTRLVEQCRQAGVREIKLHAAEGKEGFYTRLGFARRPETKPGMSLRFVAPAPA